MAYILGDRVYFDCSYQVVESLLEESINKTMLLGQEGSRARMPLSYPHGLGPPQKGGYAVLATALDTFRCPQEAGR